MSQDKVHTMQCKILGESLLSAAGNMLIHQASGESAGSIGREEK